MLLSNYRKKPFNVLFRNERFNNVCGNADVEVSWSAGAFAQPEPEVDSRSGVVGKRAMSERRCRRRERLYGAGAGGGGKRRRRRSPHPSTAYRLSVPQQTGKPPSTTVTSLWQPWQDDASSSRTVEQGTSLQTALENLRCLSVLTSTSGSAVTTSSATGSGNATSPIDRTTSSGNQRIIIVFSCSN